MTQYPNTPSIIDLARVRLEGVFEVLAYQFDDARKEQRNVCVALPKTGNAIIATQRKNVALLFRLIQKMGSCIVLLFRRRSFPGDIFRIILPKTVCDIKPEPCHNLLTSRFNSMLNHNS